MKFADRIGRISPSITLGLNARTLELRQAGRDIVSLGVGEPDIDTPEVICEAGIAAIRQRECRYTATAGTPEIRKAIVHYIKQVYGLDYDVCEVMASNGAKQVLYNSVLATVDKGDDFLIPSPYWTSYPEMVYLAGANPIIIPTLAKDQFKLTPQALEAAITPASRAILFNSPSNPTGVAYTRNDLGALAEVLRNKDIWILSDDIYNVLLFDGHRFSCFADFPELRDRTILINGVSKAFFMTGWRIGFAASSKSCIASMTKIQDHSTSCPNAISQKAAAAAMNIGPGLTADWIASLEARRDLMVELVRQIPGVSVTPPGGAFYLWVDLSAYLNKGAGSSTLELSEKLLIEGGVAVVPGEAFGEKGYVRLSFACSNEQIREGVGRMAKFLAGLG